MNIVTWVVTKTNKNKKITHGGQNKMYYMWEKI